jgi:hypothetical protein
MVRLDILVGIAGVSLRRYSGSVVHAFGAQRQLVDRLPGLAIIVKLRSKAQSQGSSCLLLLGRLSQILQQAQNREI